MNKKIANLFLALMISSSLFSQSAKEIAKNCLASTVSLIMEDKYKQPISLGSGFIIDDGKIVTNLHVIEGAKYGYVFVNGSSTKHKIQGYFVIDKKNDLAILSSPTLTGKPLSLVSSNPEIGEIIYAIGNPKGLSGTISEGIVSGIRTLENKSLIQITAPISPGSSGGPVINNSGQVMGVAVGTLTSGQNLNFAIPASSLKLLIEKQSSSILPLDISLGATLPKTSKNEVDIRNGIEISNLEWENIQYTSAFPFDNFKYLEAFSIQNIMEYPIKKVKLLIIMYGSNGRPIDYTEFEPLRYDYRGDEIAPFLSRYIDVKSWYGPGKRCLAKKFGEKIEIRILDFEIIDE